ncbi:HEAT repeat domain-containing protein [Rahnella laticis]|uniref:HEAT repeat domain-containing protein n=1 Tax=Rahnella laticis TaxID=2787622 RepID=UPI0018A2BC81|nr:HEAT repeat domain-containing protein [Rahnella laticis]MBF7996371.1 hypothetical protein [Rahnella laticis]
MNELEELVREYRSVKETPHEDEAKRIKLLFDFQKTLVSTSTKEVLDFHYECLKDFSDWQLYCYCRAAFVRRGMSVEPYLIGKLSHEGNYHVIGDIIHLLGRLRSPLALKVALEYIEKEDAYIKEVCLYVIGWVGYYDDIEVLNGYLVNGSTQLIRITAGSAMRQIFWRLPELKNHIVDYLSNAFYCEKDNSVKARMIELISTVTIKNLGIREGKNDPNVLIGDLEKAIIKTNKFLLSRNE